MRLPARVSMRVFMTADAIGGLWSYAVTLAHALTAHGDVVTLAVLGPPPSDDQRSAAAGIKGLTLIETGLPLDWSTDDVGAVSDAGKQLAKLAWACAADIVQLNSPLFAAVAHFAAPVVGVCHSCLATWWSATRADDLPADFAARTRLLSRGYANCAVLVAPSSAFAAATAAQYGVSPRVVWNADAQPCCKPETDRECYVLTAGRLWDEGKNFGTVDRAAALMTAPVYAAGPLHHPPSNVAGCRHAIALGSLPNATLRHWMTRARVFVSVAVYEPFGLAVLEAARAGAALVLSDIPTFRELWDGAALFVSPRDHEGLAAVLEALVNNAAVAAELSARSRVRAARYTVPAMREGMMAAYRAAQLYCAA
jgi:glycosyltransferase involved in cell wall biosynthesis